MKIALCQLNPTIGSFKSNTEKICKALEKAAAEGADIAVFSELVLSGYSPQDLLNRADFIRNIEAALAEFKSKLAQLKTAPRFTVLGTPTISEEKTGRTLRNSILVFEKKSDKVEVVHTQHKRLLPTYDVFDEARYFEPATTSAQWNSPFGKIGFSICEDLWFNEMYANDPALDLKGAVLNINISASPFQMNKLAQRDEALRNFVKKTKSPLIYVNQAGANDEILFDGLSSALNAEGVLVDRLPSFKETVHTINTDLVFKNSATKSSATNEFEILHRGLITGITDYFEKNGFQQALVGLSGGIDSAVVATLAAQALGAENILGVAMPGPHSSGHSLADAEKLASNLGIGFKVHPIKFIYSTLLMEVKSSFQGREPDVTEENMQARLRAIVLLALANKRNALLLTTGNKSELAVGYCTTYGDMAGALAPIGDVYKTKVFGLAKYINEKAGRELIPQNTITKPPSAELAPNQTDEGSLGAYSDLDPMLELHIEGELDESGLIEKGFETGYVQKILKLVKRSEFKRRQAAPVLKVTSKAFGIGRRIPVTRHSD